MPLTPLRAESGTGVGVAVQVVDEERVMVWDPVPLFFNSWHRGGATPRIPSMAIASGMPIRPRFQAPDAGLDRRIVRWRTGQ
jgi:hypothetical protein